MKSKISMILGIVSWGVLILMFGVSVLLAIGGGTAANALNMAIGCPLCLCILSSLIGIGFGIASLLGSPSARESNSFAWWGIGLNGCYLGIAGLLWFIGMSAGAN
jgi:hypothetical protein